MEIRPAIPPPSGTPALGSPRHAVADRASNDTQPARPATGALAVTDTGKTAGTDPAPSLKGLPQAVRTINESMQRLTPDLEFSIDEDTLRTIVKIIDRHTREVIRQVPAAEVLEIARALDRMQGLLIERKA